LFEHFHENNHQARTPQTITAVLSTKAKEFNHKDCNNNHINNNHDNNHNDNNKKNHNNSDSNSFWVSQHKQTTANTVQTNNTNKQQQIQHKQTIY
jgi:hypothetical protein